MRSILLFFAAFCLAIQFCATEIEAQPFSLPSRTELLKLRTAEIITSKGTMRFELYPDVAPWHVANFKYLADAGYYKNRPFHIVIQGFIIQGGAPTSDPNSGPGYSLPPEFSELKHEEGTLGMSRFPNKVNKSRHSHGSQFHILLTETPAMNGQYVIFGKLISGLKVLRSIEKGDLIKEVTVFVGR